MSTENHNTKTIFKSLEEKLDKYEQELFDLLNMLKELEKEEMRILGVTTHDIR